MPRIYDSSSSPLDFCKKCFSHLDEDEAFDLYGHSGDGPDDRGNCFGFDDSHPDYEGEGYRCHECKVLLTDHDN